MDLNKELKLLHTMEQVFATLIATSNKVQMAGDMYCEPLTERQYMTLLAILHLPEDETTFVNIANKLGTSKQNITQIINSLQKKDFVTIVPSPKDKRATNVRLSQAGLDTMVKCAKNVTADYMADIFKDFTQQELDLLWKLLLKLYCFDGNKMDGYEENVQIPNTFTAEELYDVLERFVKRRRG